MSDDSDERKVDLEVETRTWNKLEKAMKLFGFREGAVEGKNSSLQEGFNLGYLDGFKLGEHFGIYKGVIDSKTELNMPSQDTNHEECDRLSSEACVLCLEENTETNKKTSFENLYDIIELQESHSKEIIKTLRKSDVEPYFDKVQ